MFDVSNCGTCGVLRVEMSNVGDSGRLIHLEMISIEMSGEDFKKGRVVKGLMKPWTLERKHEILEYASERARNVQP
jgi:hypothetical protein